MILYHTWPSTVVFPWNYINIFNTSKCERWQSTNLSLWGREIKTKGADEEEKALSDKHTHTHLCWSSAHVSHHPARHTRLEDVGSGKVINLLQRHLPQRQSLDRSDSDFFTYITHRFDSLIDDISLLYKHNLVQKQLLLYIRGYMRVILQKW